MACEINLSRKQIFKLLIWISVYLTNNFKTWIESDKYQKQKKLTCTKCKIRKNNLEN